jgi:TRAP-type uncharacterized transport system substrate-binding protein
MFVALGIAALSAGPAFAQDATDGRPAAPLRRVPEAQAIERMNAWTVGLAGGLLEGAPIRFATEIARVVDDDEKMHVLPIVTRGPSENVEALLFLRGVDAAIINTDALEQFKALIPNVNQRITYLLSLFPSELHILVRPEINSLADLKGRKVNFNTPGTAAAFSGPLMFQALKLDVQATFIPHQVALEQLRTGKEDMAGVVFVTSKPVDAFRSGRWGGGFKLLPVPFEDFSTYLPSTLTHNDYPQLIPEGQEIQTIAVPTVLVAYNWPRSSDRYRRVARLTEYLFDRLDRLQTPGFHPKWKDVNLNAKVPGLERFPAAQEWLDRAAAAKVQAQAASAGGGGGQPAAPALATPEERRLYQEFLQWRRAQGR